ncbi:PREDICTED: uncharacterized protein LOC108967901 [Bactrocera latifrons]|uniref:Uncharacterized protein n=1 Tax=Bactrocera latifrons TaxID=174628 RepID=A0A0K8VR51_BACLA|nr:PREDICTED: uncharacterized protein LOC108967901 [Bactrocera latifrons]
MYNKSCSLLCVLFAIQFTAFAQPLEDDKDTQEVVDIKPPKEQSIISDTPGVQEFKKDIVSHLIASLGDEKGDETGVYRGQLSSAEVNLPCLPNDAVRIHVLRSNFRLPERLFHAPKRCSEEEKKEA